MKTAIITDDIYLEHYSRQGGIEVPERYTAVIEGVMNSVPDDDLLLVPPRAAVMDELLLCHTRDYVKSVQNDVNSGRYTLSMGDTEICDRSYEVAVRAAGGVLSAIDLVMRGDVRNAFCPVRPPGHHARSDIGAGFCIFNNVAIGARYLQKSCSTARILIVDWDVHHGDGTQDLFLDDPSVFYFSTHQWPSYPGTGRSCQIGSGKGRGTTMNCPHAIGSGRREILGSFKGKLLPAMIQFRPEFILISAGFDSEAGDHIGGFSLLENDFFDMTRTVMGIADEYCGGRIVSVLEGGYNLSGLGKMAGAHVKALVAG